MAFIAHPSVRIYGTEHDYEPISCIDPNCPTKAQHLHCPFCPYAEKYTDPVILKAHYRVKHVDKGIIFAGLKVVRCCRECDIVGAIKGEKRFRGAHWHCYRCRNGFNRRDEAIKHYKTHFRNPQTTFQIQIAQDINQVLHQPVLHIKSGSPSGHADDSLARTDEWESARKLGQTQIYVLNNDSTLIDSAEDSCMTPDIVAATEIVDTSHTYTLNTSQPYAFTPDVEADADIVEDTAEMPDEFSATLDAEETQTSEYISPEVFNRVVRQKVQAEKKASTLQTRYQELLVTNLNRENELLAQIKTLQSQLKKKSEEVERRQQRENDLQSQLQLSVDVRLQTLMKKLQQDHAEFLNAQLAKLERAMSQTKSCEQVHPAQHNEALNTILSSCSVKSIAQVQSDTEKKSNYQYGKLLVKQIITDKNNTGSGDNNQDDCDKESPAHTKVVLKPITFDKGVMPSAVSDKKDLVLTPLDDQVKPPNATVVKIGDRLFFGKYVSGKLVKVKTSEVEKLKQQTENEKRKLEEESSSEDTKTKSAKLSE